MQDQQTHHDQGRAIDQALLPADERNHFTGRCQGDTVTVTVNGTLVNELPRVHQKIKTRLVKGFIGFQASWSIPAAPQGASA